MAGYRANTSRVIDGSRIKWAWLQSLAVRAEIQHKAS